MTSCFTRVKLTHAARRPELKSAGQLCVEWMAANSPWRTSDVDNYLALEFFMGHAPHFRMDHLLDEGPGGTSMQGDEYYRVLEEEQNGSASC